MKFTGITIGVPKEIMRDERRVAAIPETVRKFVLAGASVIVERGAGEGAFFPDEKYEEVGAELVSGPDLVYGRASIIIKVKHPLYDEARGIHEANMLKRGQVLVCFLHPENAENSEMVKLLAANGVTALTMEQIPRGHRAQGMDALSSMSAVAGYKSVLLAAGRLSKFLPMMGTPVGMIRPSSLLVIGAGTAGLAAISTAKRLGAVVNCVEFKRENAEQARMLGAKVLNLGIDPELMLGEDGEAVMPDAELLEKERAALLPYVKESDVLILTPRVIGREAPMLISGDMVKSMARGSVIIDVAIVAGGCCELTVPGEIVTRHGVSIDGTRNIAGMMPSSATFMYAYNVYNVLDYLCGNGRMELDRNDEITGSILVMEQGEVLI